MLVLGGQHDPLIQCWLNVVPSFMTSSNIGPTLCQCIELQVTLYKNEMFSQCCFTAEPLP